MKLSANINGRHRPVLLITLLLGSGWAWAGGEYAVHNGTVAGGGSVAEAGPFRLISTIGEPAMGTTSGGAFRLTSGFPATVGDAIQGGPTGGHIFADGFED